MAAKFSKTTQRMVKLAYISYSGILGNNMRIPRAIRANLRQEYPHEELVWGPVIHFPRNSLFSDELLYIVRKSGTRNYTVVIRGTNPFSFKTWKEQDFNVSSLKSWKNIVTGVAAEEDQRKVSKGVHTSIGIIRDMRNEAEQNIFDFLVPKIKNKEIRRLFFTGHSLGGIMASTLALLLNDLYGLIYGVNVTRACRLYVYSFAALTAGNEEFAAYSDSILKKCYCYYNELDIIPHCFIAAELADIENIYSPNVKLLDLVMRRLFDKLKETVKTTRFAKLNNQIPIHSQVNSMFFELQMNYQHVIPYLREIIGRQATGTLLQKIGFGTAFKLTRLRFNNQYLSKIRQMALQKMPKIPLPLNLFRK